MKTSDLIKALEEGNTVERRTLYTGLVLDNQKDLLYQLRADDFDFDNYYIVPVKKMMYFYKNDIGGVMCTYDISWLSEKSGCTRLAWLDHAIEGE